MHNFSKIDKKFLNCDMQKFLHKIRRKNQQMLKKIEKTESPKTKEEFLLPNCIFASITHKINKE